MTQVLLSQVTISHDIVQTFWFRVTAKAQREGQMDMSKALPSPGLSSVLKLITMETHTGKLSTAD